MFTFVIWAIGLAIMAGMAYVNFIIVALAFEKHWFLGILCILASLVGWLILFVLVF
jgi:hypothetical protein